jgi:hypothetical protein
MRGEEPLPPSHADAPAPPARFGTRGSIDLKQTDREDLGFSGSPVPGPWSLVPIRVPRPDHFNLISRNRSSRYPCAVIGSG